MTVKYEVAGKYLVIRLYTFQTGIQHSLCWAHTKNPFKIHKLFANLCNMVQKHKGTQKYATLLHIQ